MGKNAHAAARILNSASTKLKNDALINIADNLEANADKIISANKIDLENGKINGLSAALLDRLMLNGERINGIANAVREIAESVDPIGEILEGFVRPNGLRVRKVRVPLGVIGIIYESRPNVTADAAALCFKSGNAVNKPDINCELTSPFTS